jgi:hypothetical protein
MPATPAVQAVREALVDQVGDRMTTSNGAWFNTTVVEDAISAFDLKALPMVQVTRESMTTNLRNIQANRRSMDVEFSIRGFVETSTNVRDIERLEQDLARAIAHNPKLGVAATITAYESGEFSDEEVESDGGRVRVSSFEASLTVTVYESLS